MIDILDTFIVLIHLKFSPTNFIFLLREPLVFSHYKNIRCKMNISYEITNTENYNFRAMVNVVTGTRDVRR